MITKLLTALNINTDTVNQIIDSLQQAASTTAAAEPETLSVWYLLKEGGILMIPLLVCSILTVYIFVERYLAIKKAGSTPPDYMLRIKDQIHDGNISSVITMSNNYQGALPKVIIKGAKRIGKPIDHIERSMENAAKLEVYQMEKNIDILSTIARIAPMFGFLGTLTGMLILFFNIQHSGFTIESFASGIYTKMVTSAVGLIIGLLAYVGYDYLNAQINKNANKLETGAMDFLDMLHEPAK